MAVRSRSFIFTVFVIMIFGLAISCTSIEKVETVEKVVAEEKAEATEEVTAEETAETAETVAETTEEAAKETTTTVEEVSGQ